MSVFTEPFIFDALNSTHEFQISEMSTTQHSWNFILDLNGTPPPRIYHKWYSNFVIRFFAQQLRDLAHRFWKSINKVYIDAMINDHPFQQDLLGFSLSVKKFETNKNDRKINNPIRKKELFRALAPTPYFALKSMTMPSHLKYFLSCRMTFRQQKQLYSRKRIAHINGTENHAQGVVATCKCGKFHAYCLRISLNNKWNHLSGHQVNEIWCNELKKKKKKKKSVMQTMVFGRTGFNLVCLNRL